MGVGRLSMLAPVLLAPGPSSMNCILHGITRKSHVPQALVLIYILVFLPCRSKCGYSS